MAFGQSMVIRHAIRNALESSGIKPEVAASLSSVAGVVTAVIFLDHHSTYISEKSSQVLADSISEKDFDLENQMATDFDAIANEVKNTMTSVASSIENQKYNALHNSDNNEIEKIFAQIDLAQARITKDQEEIQSLAKETDELLNQLEYKAS